MSMDKAEKLQHCLTFLESLSDYVDEELDETTRRAIDAHARACLGCRVCLKTFKRTVALLQRLDCKPVPPQFSLRLKKALRDIC